MGLKNTIIFRFGVFLARKSCPSTSHPSWDMFAHNDNHAHQANNNECWISRHDSHYSLVLIIKMIIIIIFIIHTCHTRQRLRKLSARRGTTWSLVHGRKSYFIKTYGGKNKTKQKSYVLPFSLCHKQYLIMSQSFPKWVMN